MSVIALIVLLAVLGFVAWLCNTKVPMSSTIKTIINIVIIVVAIWLVLGQFGILDEVRSIKVPHL